MCSGRWRHLVRSITRRSGGRQSIADRLGATSPHCRAGRTEPPGCGPDRATTTNAPGIKRPTGAIYVQDDGLGTGVLGERLSPPPGP